jgi:hypothetical protein
VSDTAATTDATTTDATTTDATTTDATAPTSGATTDAPVAACQCDDPVVHEGTLEVAGLAAYAGKCLVEVTDGLELRDIVDPAVLAPLANLERVGWLSLSSNPGLVDLAPFGCLREVRSLSFYDNAALVDLGALARIESAERLHIDTSPITALPTFAPGYHGIRSLSLRDLPELTDLDAMAGWPGLHNPEGFYEEMTLHIVGAPKLTSVAGLESALADGVAAASPNTLLSAPSIELADLPALTSLVGLEPLDLASLTLRHLPKITDLTPLANLTDARDVVLAGLDALPSLAGLDNLKTAESLTLGGCDEGDALSITDLSGLASLSSVDYRLALVDVPAMTDLTGAPALKNLGALEVVDAPLVSDAAVAALAAQTNVADAGVCAGDIVDCGCLGTLSEPLWRGCPAVWSDTAAVTGDGDGAPFNGVTAFLGLWGDNSTSAELVVVLLDATSDVAAAKESGLDNPSAGAPAVVLRTGRTYHDWLGASQTSATLHLAGGVMLEGMPGLDITKTAGDWANLDPADPPRLLGQLTTADPNAPLVLNGSFDAAFCDAFFFPWVD